MTCSRPTRRHPVSAIALLFGLGLTVLAAAAAAQPVIAEPGWTLIRTIAFDNPLDAVLNPVDGRIYVARRDGTGDGLHRIDALGFAVQVAAGTYLAGVVVDPTTGDIFHSDSYGGVIYRTQLGQAGRQTWVSGFHSGDDDPMGLAIAPADYTGDVLAPGEALTPDGGYTGPDEVWRWSPAVAEGEVLLHVDDGTLVEAVDVAIGQTTVHLVDRAETSPGVIYAFGAGGTLTPLATSQALADPVGIAVDPWTGDLLVLDEASGRVVRVDPASGEVSDVITGVATAGVWGGVNIMADGRRLVVSATSADEIYVFARCDATGDPVADCDGNGVYDACDVAAGAPDCNQNGVPDPCDITSGASQDCNLDGLPDDCPVCPPVEVVFVMDTSASMDDEATALCGSMNQVVATLEAAGLAVEPRLLAICDLPGGAYACLENHVAALLGTAVPGSPPPDLEVLGACPGGNEVCQEDWALATAVVAGLYGWLPAGQSVRLVIPVADEGPWGGDPVTTTDSAAIQHAITVARSAGVLVSPIIGSGASTAVRNLAAALADSTGGQDFNSTTPSLDIAESIVDLVLGACASFTDCNQNGTLDECDIASGTSPDLNHNGIPDECEVLIGVGETPPRVGAVALAQNVPNPFNPATTIAFELPRAGTVDLAVFALDGRRVASLVAGHREAGRHAVVWNGRDERGRTVASGTYVYRLQANGEVRTRRLVVLK